MRSRSDVTFAPVVVLNEIHEAESSLKLFKKYIPVPLSAYTWFAKVNAFPSFGDATVPFVALNAKELNEVIADINPPEVIRILSDKVPEPLAPEKIKLADRPKLASELYTLSILAVNGNAPVAPNNNCPADKLFAAPWDEFESTGFCSFS